MSFHWEERSRQGFSKELDWSFLLSEVRLSCTCASFLKKSFLVLPQATSVRLYFAVYMLTLWLLVSTLLGNLRLFIGLAYSNDQIYYIREACIGLRITNNSNEGQGFQEGGLCDPYQTGTTEWKVRGNAGLRQRDTSKRGRTPRPSGARQRRTIVCRTIIPKVCHNLVKLIEEEVSPSKQHIKTVKTFWFFKKIVADLNNISWVRRPINSTSTMRKVSQRSREITHSSLQRPIQCGCPSIKTSHFCCCKWWRSEKGRVTCRNQLSRRQLRTLARLMSRTSRSSQWSCSWCDYNALQAERTVILCSLCLR